MKITVVGPGALGTLVAARLARCPHEVWILDHHRPRAERLLKNGLRVEGLHGSFSAKVRTTTDSRDIADSAFVFLCVKSFDTERTVRGLAPLHRGAAKLLSFQNGIGNLQIIEECIEHERIIAGVTAQAAYLKKVGLVHHAGEGPTVIGQENGRVLGPVREASRLLQDAGIPTKTTRDIRGALWSKLIINVGINALSALTRLKNGALGKDEHARIIMRLAVSEAVKVAKRKRIKLQYDDPIQKVEAVCAATADNKSSMLQDILKKSPTEIDFINGAIVRYGKSLGVKTPVNELLTQLITILQSHYGAQVTG